MGRTQKQELVSCYEQDLRDAADSADTSLGQAQAAFISWLDDEMTREHTAYYVGRVDGRLATLLRVHDDQVPDQLLIEALQTVTAVQGQGLASQLLAEVVRTAPASYCADVHTTNVASQATFARAGFTKATSPVPQHDRWRLDTTHG
jgi:GNAT superfamily N-acetyltransferase